MQNVLPRSGARAYTVSDDASADQRYTLNVQHISNYRDATNCVSTNDHFLANSLNKQSVIFTINVELKKNNCETRRSSGVTDLIVVLKTLLPATSVKTVIASYDLLDGYPASLGFLSCTKSVSYPHIA